jgi:hypothetical protein
VGILSAIFFIPAQPFPSGLFRRPFFPILCQKNELMTIMFRALEFDMMSWISSGDMS